MFIFRLFLEQEFDQHRHDVDLPIEQKNKLGESFLSLQQSRESERLSVSEDSSHMVLQLLIMSLHC